MYFLGPASFVHENQGLANLYKILLFQHMQHIARKLWKNVVLYLYFCRHEHLESRMLSCWEQVKSSILLQLLQTLSWGFWNSLEKILQGLPCQQESSYTEVRNQNAQTQSVNNCFKCYENNLKAKPSIQYSSICSLQRYIAYTVIRLCCKVLSIFVEFKKPCLTDYLKHALHLFGHSLILPFDTFETPFLCISWKIFKQLVFLF